MSDVQVIEIMLHDPPSLKYTDIIHSIVLSLFSASLSVYTEFNKITCDFWLLNI